eukprot:TRINITY_DN1435_c0_g2_i3.p2 TRINITY_DN1435_c0_g2~~TRINITY_DN1435_c0_g2_i3.p2  ORF type:complete len:178 (+),score=33.71 TRINITY_DN1435_c0_g2_i3:918-1451(+)
METPKLLLVGGMTEDERCDWIEEQIKIDKLRHELNLVTDVIFVGSKTHTELALYYNAAGNDSGNSPKLNFVNGFEDIHLMPSLYESFGMCVLEALASGIPSILSTKSGLMTVLHDGVDCFIVDPDDHLRMAQQMEFLLRNPDAALQMGANGRATVRSLSWESISCSILELYSTLMSR